MENESKSYQILVQINSVQNNIYIKRALNNKIFRIRYNFCTKSRLSLCSSVNNVKKGNNQFTANLYPYRTITKRERLMDSNNYNMKA